MRIAIATNGRFHVLDLARELALLGHEVAFYSCVPRALAVRFGLPPPCHRGLLRHVVPWATLQRCTRNERLRERINQRLALALDRLVGRLVEPCEVFIGMSGIYLTAGVSARAQYGAAFILERGSRHILSQKEILEGIPIRPGNGSGISEFTVARELAGYAVADVVAVPAHHAVHSFLERGFPPEKLFRNAYGVDISMFPATMMPAGQPPTILYVGAWSLQKGCDLLVEAWQRLPGVRLLHVGAVLDAALPASGAGSGFVHHEPVPQWDLKRFYAQAHVFALASRQEGLSLVQAQALACGLPVVCTDRTGGEDLREIIRDPEMITVVPHDDVAGLAAGLKTALGKALSANGLRDGLGNSREKLSWRAYGERYEAFLHQLARRNECGREAPIEEKMNRI